MALIIDHRNVIGLLIHDEKFIVCPLWPVGVDNRRRDLGCDFSRSGLSHGGGSYSRSGRCARTLTQFLPNGFNRNDSQKKMRIIDQGLEFRAKPCHFLLRICVGLVVT